VRVWPAVGFASGRRSEAGAARGILCGAIGAMGSHKVCKISGRLRELHSALGSLGGRLNSATARRSISCTTVGGGALVSSRGACESRQF
jgi:hypothetical protein